MEKFFSDASTLYWWVSVVALNLVINVLSNYLKTPIDKLGSSLFRRWRLRTERAKQRHEARVAYYRAHPHVAPGERAQESRYRQREQSIYLQACYIMLMAVLVFAFAQSSASKLLDGRLHLLVPIGVLLLIVFVSFAYAVASRLGSRAEEIADCLREAGLDGLGETSSQLKQ